MRCSHWSHAPIIICDVCIYLFFWLRLSWPSLYYIIVGSSTEITCVADLAVFVFECGLEQS